MMTVLMVIAMTMASVAPASAQQGSTVKPLPPPMVMPGKQGKETQTLERHKVAIR